MAPNERMPHSIFLWKTLACCSTVVTLWEPKRSDFILVHSIYCTSMSDLLASHASILVVILFHLISCACFTDCVLWSMMIWNTRNHSELHLRFLMPWSSSATFSTKSLPTAPEGASYCFPGKTIRWLQYSCHLASSLMPPHLGVVRRYGGHGLRRLCPSFYHFVGFQDGDSW
jgi:hypothetical protein